MPIGIFLYEIDESFGPNLLSEYSVKEVGITKEILKTLADKHLEKPGLKYNSLRTDTFKFYSREIKINDKKALILGFILSTEEYVDSLFAVFDEIETKMVKNFTEDKNELKSLLKEILHARIESRDKLKEPKLIKEKMNERTKDLLDEGKIQEARELIDLGEIIPDEMAHSIKLAGDFFKAKDFRSAKKNFIRAAELAEKIGELEISKILNSRAKTAENYPIYVKEREDAYKEIKRLLQDIDLKKSNYYQQSVKSIQKIIEISNILEDYLNITELNKLVNLCNENSKLSEEIKLKDELIKDILDKLI